MLSAITGNVSVSANFNSPFFRAVEQSILGLVLIKCLLFICGRVQACDCDAIIKKSYKFLSSVLFLFLRVFIILVSRQPHL